MELGRVRFPARLQIKIFLTMNRTEKLFAVLLIALTCAVFYALINYLGGYGAIIASCIIAGLVNLGVEKSTEQDK